ncbi:MAG: glycosyltransferase family 9 protein [bacterium]
MNILILRVSAIGDVIHTLPSIFLIKKLIPMAKISWAVQKKAASLITNQPFLDKVFILPDKFLSFKNLGQTNKILKEINLNKWDIIIDFQGILKTSILSFFIPGKKIGFDKKNARLGLTSFFINKQITPIYTNIIQKNMALASGALQEILKENFKSCPTIENIKNNFELTIPIADKEIVQSWIQEKSLNKFIILSPNTTWPSKHWPEKNWIKLINRLSTENSKNHTIVLLGKDFGDQAKDIYEYCNKNNINIIAAPKWNLLQTSYLILKSKLLIAPDTGILHLADFLQKKSIGIFGPTLAKKHGPFLLTENIKNVIQIECPHFYQKTHRNSKRSSNIVNCMYKLTPENLTLKIISMIKE